MSVESRQRPRKIAQYREGDAAGEHFDNAIERMLTVSKDEIQRREQAAADARKARRERKAG